jgi:hypothetical protein
MSEAPRARKPHALARSLTRAFLLVLGTLAFLVLVGPRDARALDVGPVGGAVDRVAQPVGGAVDRVAQPVGRVVDRAARPVGDVADQVADGMGGAVDQIASPVGRLAGDVAGRVRGAAGQLGNRVKGALDQLGGQVEGALDQVVEPVRDLVGGSPSGNRVEHDTPLPGSPDEPLPSENRTGTRTRPVTEGSTQPSAPAGLPAPIDQAYLSQPTGASDTSFPAGSPWIPVGPSSALMGGSWETGGRGLPLNAALLAAALALAVALSRWLRLLPDARALNPFLSRVEVPG